MKSSMDGNTLIQNGLVIDKVIMYSIYIVQQTGGCYINE
jgi:hypothetical protein